MRVLAVIQSFFDFFLLCRSRILNVSSHQAIGVSLYLCRPVPFASSVLVMQVLAQLGDTAGFLPCLYW